MIAAAMGGEPFRWPAGCYVNNDEFQHIMMAMETKLDANGVEVLPVHGTEEEHTTLVESYKHLCALRDEVIAMGVIPAVEDWHKVNPNL